MNETIKESQAYKIHVKGKTSYPLQTIRNDHLLNYQIKAPQNLDKEDRYKEEYIEQWEENTF